jgi:hypothetical protein
MPTTTKTFECYRPALVCAECGSDLDRTSLRCSHDEAHTGTEMHDEGCLIEVECYASFSPVIPGRYSGPPEDCYPDEGGDLDDFTATVDGKDFPLTDEEEKRAVDSCAKDAFDPANRDDYYDGPDPDDYDDRW